MTNTTTLQNLTENEQKIVSWINQEIEDGNTLIYACDAEYGSGLDNKIARGVISSLVKKGLIDVNKQDGGLISRFW